MVLPVLSVLTGAGCVAPWLRITPFVSTLEVVDFRDAQNVRPYQEEFPEAFYDLDGHGNLNLVLRRQGGESGESRQLTQVVRVRSVWRPVPGRSISDPTQINAVISYYVVGGKMGDTFEGAGSVFFQADGSDALKGSVDHAVLRSQRQLSAGEPLFPRAELSGKFRAVRDRRQVVRIINELNRQFGPLPPHDRPNR